MPLTQARHKVQGRGQKQLSTAVHSSCVLKEVRRGRGRKGPKEESAGANTQRRNQARSCKLSSVARISGAYREMRAGEAKAGAPAGKEVTRGFSMSLAHLQAQPALGRGGPADGAVLTQKRPVFSLSIISPPATQLWHFFSSPPATSSTHRNVRSMAGRAGSRDAPPLLGSICRHTLPESNQTRGVARTAHFCS